MVGNPRSLQRLVDNGRLRLQQVSMVVIDEVDSCLIDPTTRQELHRLLSRFLSTTYQTAEEGPSVCIASLPAPNQAVFLISLGFVSFVFRAKPR